VLKGTVVALKGTVVALKDTVVALKGTVAALKGTVVPAAWRAKHSRTRRGTAALHVLFPPCLAKHSRRTCK
jgi:hypothetical protein